MSSMYPPASLIELLVAHGRSGRRVTVDAEGTGFLSPSAHALLRRHVSVVRFLRKVVFCHLSFLSSTCSSLSKLRVFGAWTKGRLGVQLPKAVPLRFVRGVECEWIEPGRVEEGESINQLKQSVRKSKVNTREKKTHCKTYDLQTLPLRCACMVRDPGFTFPTRLVPNRAACKVRGRSSSTLTASTNSLASFAFRILIPGPFA